MENYYTEKIAKLEKRVAELEKEHNEDMDAVGRLILDLQKTCKILKIGFMAQNLQIQNLIDERRDEDESA